MITHGGLSLICGLISAKWALDLELSQSRQVLLLIAGIVFGPLTLLILYVSLIRKSNKEGRPGARMV